jgi:hypothetical protein
MTSEGVKAAVICLPRVFDTRKQGLVTPSGGGRRPLRVFGALAGLDLAASSTLTQERLGWHPTGPGLIADLDQMRYFED